MRALPNMTVLAPGDPTEVEFLTRWMLRHDGPCYLRLGKAGEPRLHTATEFTAGKIIELRGGRDVLLLSTGGMLQTTLQVADQLQTRGIMAGVASCPFVKPLDHDYLTVQAAGYPWFATIEEHTRPGGFGEAVGALLATLPVPTARLLPFFVPELALKGISGSQSELLKRIRLDAPSIAEAIATRLAPAAQGAA